MGHWQFTQAHTLCLCFHCRLCYAKCLAAERSWMQPHCAGEYLCPNSWSINPQLSVGCEQEGGRELELQERNQDTCWLLQGAFVYYCQWASMALFSSWEKANDRPSELPQNMSRSLCEAENVQFSGKSRQMLCALPKQTKP